MKYIASWSGGKDSTASIILAHEHNEPLDLIIFAEVMFDNETSGELPEHIQRAAYQFLKVGGIRSRYFIQRKRIWIVFIIERCVAKELE